MKFPALLQALMLSLALTAPNTVFAQETAPPFDAQAMREQSKAMPGFFDLYWDEAGGRLFLELDKLDQPFLYLSWLARGVGSNDLGLDRGQLGRTRLVQFERVGPRVLLVQLNTRYIAGSADVAEQQAVSESFARSVLAGFDVVAEENGRLLLDVTDFAMRDSHQLGASLKELEEGDYNLDPALSALHLPKTASFPDNTEIEAMVTLVGQAEGKFLATVSPDADRVTVHLHQSFVRLPEPGYEAVPYEPRAGYMDAQWTGSGYADYASALGDPLKGAWLPRHRLEKLHPERGRSAAREPIVYYLDRGVPEPMRSALLEGARWWNQAYTAAGYIDAFRVELLPEGADPMDVRYNVIQWVHRSTRGWSYGSSVIDPRSGEIIKGHVSLGSLRVRQNYLMAEGLLSPHTESQSGAEAQKFALARLRQLSAHEVGHTLGLEHNFAASSDDRASVMDYPHPLIRVDAQGKIDLSDAYTQEIGAWDKRAIMYGYQDFPAGADRVAGRAAIMAETLATGRLYIDDADGRSVATAHPQASLWDNGSNALDELERLLQVRAVALASFSEAVIAPGRSWASLEEPLVPVYLLHRYQLQAAGKYLGGQYFSYAQRGDGQRVTQPVPSEQQWRALELLLATLEPELLALPVGLALQIPARPQGMAAGRELFRRSTGGMFDPLAPAEASVALSMQVLLNPRRAARLQRSGQPEGPDFAAVLKGLLEHSWYLKQGPGVGAALQQAINNQVLAALLALAINDEAAPEVRALTLDALLQLQQKVERRPGKGSWRAQSLFASAQIELVLKGADSALLIKPAIAPPGSPI